MTKGQQEKLRLEMAESLKGMDGKEMAELMDSYRQEEEAFDEQRKIRKFQAELIERVYLPAWMENIDEDLEKLSIEGLGTLTKSNDFFLSVPAANKDDLRIWLLDNGHATMVKDTVNSSTLKAFVAEGLKSGATLPFELLKITPYTKVKLKRN